MGNLVRARRWDLTTTEKTTFGTPASVNGATINHPTRNPEVEMRYKYDGGQRVVKTVTRGDAYATSHNDTAPKYTVYAFSTVELRSAKWVGTGATADYELTSATTELMLPAGSVMGRVISDGIMPKTGTTQQHLLLTFADHLGSTTFTIDHATSELVEYTTYTAYGQTESDYRTSRWDNRREPRRFTGKEEDIEVGLNYHGARYYSPAMKRWMSADPVTVHSAGSDINPWAYGYGNPTSFVDPDGRCPIVAIVVIAAVVSAATSATVQYATTGHVDWGWKGVAGAALAGAVGGAVGAGVGIAAAGYGATAAGALGGAAGGATSGGLGTALAGGNATAVFKSALTGAVSGAVGGAVGVSAGSPSANAGTAFGGSMAGTAAGTYAGVMFGAAAWGQEPTWQSIGTSFMSAFAGTMASTALSKGWSAATESNTAGKAAQMEREVADAIRERQGAFRAKESGASGNGVGSGQPCELLELDRATMNYRLNADGRALLQPIFDRWGFDVSVTQAHFTSLPGASGMALGDLVLLDPESWMLSTPDERVLTLAHEMTHSVQYRQLGTGAFLGRYASEWSSHSQTELYKVPDALLNDMNQGRNLVNVTNGNYLLDQMAETIGTEASRRYRAQ